MSGPAGRVALVTGAARGQGRAHALALARAGADVVADMEAAVARAGELGALRVVCANAGVISFGRSWELSEAQWDQVVATNLRASGRRAARPFPA